MTRRLPIIVLALVWATVGGAQPNSPDRPRAGIDVLSYEFHISLPTVGRSISAVATMRIRRYRPIDTLEIDLAGLTVDSVAVEKSTKRFLRDDATIRIPSAWKPFVGDDTTEVSVAYHGTVDDGLIIRTDTGGRWMAFGDNWPDRARRWLACVDHPSDKATVTWSVDAPASLTVIANGVLLGQTTEGNRTTTRWQESQPIPTYCMVIAAASMKKFDLGLTARGLSEFGSGVPQSVYVLPEQYDVLPGPFARAGDIVSFFAHTIAPFPYEKLAHLQSATTYGGMENASCIFYADDKFQRRTMSTGLIAHETAHQWFGDAVTPREWGHIWLSEGFATYFEELWQQHDRGDSVFQAILNNSRDEIIHSRVAAKRPVIDTLQTNLNALLNINSYSKGAWVLHMLRSMFGDEKFFTALRTYYRDFKHGTAVTEDLQREFEAVAGEPLDWYFHQWLRRPGQPELHLRWSYRVEKRTVEVQASQTQKVDPFRFPLHVDVIGEDGSIVHTTVNVPAEREATMSIPVGDVKPIRLLFDPHVELLAAIVSE